MSASFTAGHTLQMAAALAFHLPGTRLELSGADGSQCVVGSLTDPQCALHPAEFRDLVVHTGGALDTASSYLGSHLACMTQMSLNTVMVGVQHLGIGLYRVMNKSHTSYTFATPLTANKVDAVLLNMQTHVPIEYSFSSPISPHKNNTSESEAVIAVSLIQDDGLGVTLVVMSSAKMLKGVSEDIAYEAVSACLVAEIESSVQNSV